MQIQVTVVPSADNLRGVVVDHERVLSLRGAAHCHGMPLVVIQGHLVVVSHPNRPVAEVEDQVDVSVDELDGQEVVTCRGKEEEVGRA